MILDIDRFLAGERAIWKELEDTLHRFEANPAASASIPELERFHYLYQRTASAYARLQSNSGDREVVLSLEALVARAYAEVHQKRDRSQRFRFLPWLLRGFPQTFRRHLGAFALATALTIAGTGLGAGALVALPESKAALMPFSQLLEKPSARVAREESSQKGKPDRLAGFKTSFAAQLMTHNIQVAVFTLALGVTWGLGVVTLLFYNGVSLGAVICDYIRDGQWQFLMGWLMPHGVIEIPAILVGGQAGFVLAAAIIGSRETRRRKLEAARADIASLAGGLAVMLVWAGIVEAFISQYHWPVLPYGVKIAIGFSELAVLVAWLSRGGRGEAKTE